MDQAFHSDSLGRKARPFLPAFRVNLRRELPRQAVDHVLYQIPEFGPAFHVWSLNFYVDFFPSLSYLTVVDNEDEDEKCLLKSILSSS